MAITEDAIQQAEARMADTRDHAHAVEAYYDCRTQRVIVRLQSGLELAIPPDLIEGLAEATQSNLADIELSPSGLGLHWPQLDADLYVPALLEGQFGSRQWMTQQLDTTKTKSARASDFKGARPHQRQA